MANTEGTTTTAPADTAGRSDTWHDEAEAAGTEAAWDGVQGGETYDEDGGEEGDEWEYYEEEGYEGTGETEATTDSLYDGLLEDGIKIGEDQVTSAAGSGEKEADQAPSAEVGVIKERAAAPASAPMTSSTPLPSLPAAPHTRSFSPRAGGFRQGGQPQRLGYPSQFHPYSARPPIAHGGNKIHINPAKFMALQGASARFNPYTVSGRQQFIPGYGYPPMGMGANMYPGMQQTGVRNGMGFSAGGGMSGMGGDMRASRGNVHRQSISAGQNRQHPPSNANSGTQPKGTFEHKINPSTRMTSDMAQAKDLTSPRVAQTQIRNGDDAAEVTTAPQSRATVSNLSSSATADAIRNVGTQAGLRMTTVDIQGKTAEVGFATENGARVFRRMFHKTDICGSRVEISVL
ncbi:hypothetical protein DFJ77DRAFT_451299 [Powellomyces hirtus]|nr:hypothetical protein DFJ77DRAFT_451299 [Powellomyces hirtus]